MKKNVLIISTSPRKSGNSQLLAEEFARGVKKTGNQVELISLSDKTIGFCKGCLACQKTKLSGTVFAGGVAGMGEIKGHPALSQAYEMGKAV